jgi:hypothetical protein
LLIALLPWAALGVALLALLARDAGHRAEAETPREGRGGALWLGSLLLAGLVFAAGWNWQEVLPESLPAAWGFAGGAAFAAVAGLLGAWRFQPATGVSGPVALGAAGAALLTFLPLDAREPYQLGAIAGAGLGAWLLGGFWPSRAAIYLSLALLGDVLGFRAMEAPGAHAGSTFALLGALAAIIALGVPVRQGAEARPRTIALLLAAAGIVLGAWLLATRHFFVNDLWMIFAGSAAVGLVAAYAAPDDAPDGGFGFVLSVVLWLAVATLAFGMRQGLGMAVAALGGAAMLAALGRTRALLTMGPFLLLVLYRVFREMHPEASRAIDIGQHYALIGLAAGAALPILASEWRRSRETGTAGAALAAWLWCPVLLAVPFVAAVVLSAKGYIGVLVGLGFGAFLEGVRGPARLEPLAVSAGLGSAMTVSYGWLLPQLDLTREEKVAQLAYAAAGLAVLAILIALLSRPARPRAERGAA